MYRASIRVVPYEGGEDPEAQENIADDNTADTHLNATDVKGLLRVVGMRANPHIRPAMTTAAQRDLRYLWRKGIENAREMNSSETAGIKPINSNHDPRDVRVDHRAVGNIRRAPSTELLGCDVKEDLVGQKGRSHGQAEDGAEEKALRAQARWRKLAPDLDLVRVVAPVQRLGRRGEKEDEDALGSGRRTDC